MATATTTTEASQDTPSKLLTEKEVAAILNCCEKTVFTMRKDGKIRCVKIGAAVRCTPEEIKRFIESQMNQAGDSTNSSNGPSARNTGSRFELHFQNMLFSKIFLDGSVSMNYDFALAMLVLLALVIIGKPDVLREVTKLAREIASVFGKGKQR
tara:strand:+ start:47474 stop:47935 length:462 start_codon:yes stop_codon:yes gene_type:complete